MLYHRNLSTLILSYIFGLIHIREIWGYALKPASPLAFETVGPYSDSSGITPIIARACATPNAQPIDSNKRDLPSDGKTCWTNDVESDDNAAIENPVPELNNIFGIQSRPITNLALSLPAGGETDLFTQILAGSGESLTQESEIILPDEFNLSGDAVPNYLPNQPPTLRPLTDLTGPIALDLNTQGGGWDTAPGTGLEAAKPVNYVPQDSSNGRPDMDTCHKPYGREDNDLYVVHHVVFKGPEARKVQWPHAIIVSDMLLPYDRKYTAVLNRPLPPKYSKTEGPQLFLDEDGKPVLMTSWIKKGWLYAIPKEQALAWFETLAKTIQGPATARGAYSTIATPPFTQVWVGKVFYALNDAVARHDPGAFNSEGLPYWISVDSQENLCS